MRAAVRVDRYEPADFTGAYRVCLATGDAGEDATGRFTDPNLLGHLYVGPYLSFEPRLAFVLRDGDGVFGYALGARDTAAFEARCEAHWWPPLRAMYPRQTHRPHRDAALVDLIHAPERTPVGLLASHPSHLHIDLLPVGRSRGLGRAMIEAVLESLFAEGSPGVHLGVDARNARAIGFYEHLGFTHLGREDGGGLLMGLTRTQRSLR